MHASGVLTRCHTREVPNLIPRSPRVELVRGRGVRTHPWLLGQPDGLSSAGVTTSTAGGCRRAGFATGARWSTASSARPTGRRSSTWREHLTCRAGRWSAMRCLGGRGTAGRDLPAWVRSTPTPPGLASVGRHVAELMTMVGVEAYAVHGPGRCRANQGARGPAERLPDAERLVLHDDHGGTCL